MSGGFPLTSKPFPTRSELTPTHSPAGLPVARVPLRVVPAGMLGPRGHPVRPAHHMLSGGDLPGEPGHLQRRHMHAMHQLRIPGPHPINSMHPPDRHALHGERVQPHEPVPEHARSGPLLPVRRVRPVPAGVLQRRLDLLRVPQARHLQPPRRGAVQGRDGPGVRPGVLRRQRGENR